MQGAVPGRRSGRRRPGRRRRQVLALESCRKFIGQAYCGCGVHARRLFAANAHTTRRDQVYFLHRGQHDCGVCVSKEPSTEASISSGILLLSFYSLGLAIPFILSGYFMNSFLTSKKGFSKYYNRVTKIGGVVLLITGILIATNQIQVISYYILTTFPFLTSLG